MKLILLFLSLLLSLNCYTQDFKDIMYAQTPQHNLGLDIYVPKAPQNKALVIWIHGGAWQTGSKANPPTQLLNKGYFLASIDFRNTPEAPFPAMVHDIKAAIRYLRANAPMYGYDPDKLILWGSSSGGHLVSLVGLSSGDSFLEGSLGDYTSVPSKVQLIVDFYGPTNFTTILTQSTPHGQNVRRPALALFFAKPIDENSEDFQKASPVNYVDKNDPPVFLAHGNQDPQVPINQTLELWSLLERQKVPHQLEILQETAHGGGKFNEAEIYDKLVNFIQNNMK